MYTYIYIHPHVCTYVCVHNIPASPQGSCRECPLSWLLMLHHVRPWARTSCSQGRICVHARAVRHPCLIRAYAKCKYNSNFCFYSFIDTCVEICSHPSLVRAFVSVHKCFATKFFAHEGVSARTCIIKDFLMDSGIHMQIVHVLVGRSARSF